MKVETEAEDAALDCSVNSRTSEKHSVDSVLAALQDSSKRKQLVSDGLLDSVPGVKRRRLIPEVRARPLSLFALALTLSDSMLNLPLLLASQQLLNPWAWEDFI